MWNKFIRLHHEDFFININWEMLLWCSFDEYISLLQVLQPVLLLVTKTWQPVKRSCRNLPIYRYNLLPQSSFETFNISIICVFDFKHKSTSYKLLSTWVFNQLPCIVDHKGRIFTFYHCCPFFGTLSFASLLYSLRFSNLTGKVYMPYASISHAVQHQQWSTPYLTGWPLCLSIEEAVH